VQNLLKLLLLVYLLHLGKPFLLQALLQNTSKVPPVKLILDVLPEELLITVVLSKVVEPDKVPKPISNVDVPCSKIQ
jgi:hypothetical protein